MDGLLVGISYYLVPAIIVALSLAALLLQEAPPAETPDTQLAFRALPDPDAALTPESARTKIANRPLTNRFGTARAEHPFWLLLPLDRAGGQRTVVTLPSRHVRNATCWSADSLRQLGSAGEHGPSGAMRAVGAGFALDLSALPGRPAALLCRTRYAGPANITAAAWPPEALTRAEHEYHRGAGLLTGGLLTLASFALVMALVNRESRYVLLAAWLVLNLRMGGLSLGWDTHWLGFQVSPDWLSFTRQITIALYYLVIYTLFSQFFRLELKQVGLRGLLRLGQASTLFLLALALSLPYAAFLPIMWVTVALGITAMIVLLARILFVTRSRTAMWYAAALGVIFVAYFSEIIAAATQFRWLVTTLNGVTAALASSVLVMLALAEQIRAEKRERVRAQEALSRTYETTPIGLFTLDHEGRFRRRNTALRGMLERDGLPVADSRWSDHFEPGAWDTLKRISAQPGGGEAELRGRGGDPDTAPWYLVRALATTEQFEGSLQDITERVRATERLRFLANHDPLTGVLNRHGIEAVLDEIATRAGRGRPAAVALFDIKRFKLINDLYRSQAGNEVLKQFARRIETRLPPPHAVGRLGGDEFLAVLPDTTLTQARRIVEGILAAANDRPYEFGHQRLQVRIAGGLIELEPGVSSATAVATAGRACEEAKRETAGPLVVYDHNAPAFREGREELELIKLFGEDALPAGLYLMMQPILSLHRPFGSLNFEVLLRMTDDGGNAVPVGKLLAAAESSGNMARLDKWVLAQTLEWLEQHLPSLGKTRFVNVNFSGASLNDSTFIHDVFNILARYRAVVPHLCIEITEGVALHDLEYGSHFVNELKQQGVNIALDDFGAGYTSFSYLRNLQADALKIDGAFVRSMNRHPANVAIVGAMLELAHNLGMRSIAEGAEDLATLDTLVELGAHYVQGYVIARPQPLDAALSRDSAADFITDPDVATRVRLLEAPETEHPATGKHFH